MQEDIKRNLKENITSVELSKVTQKKVMMKLRLMLPTSLDIMLIMMMTSVLTISLNSWKAFLNLQVSMQIRQKPIMIPSLKKLMELFQRLRWLSFCQTYLVIVMMKKVMKRVMKKLLECLDDQLINSNLLRVLYHSYFH